MDIQNEQEGIACVLHAAIDIDGQLTEFEIDKISNILCFCRKFKDVNMKELTAKVFYLKEKHGCVKLMSIACAHVEENFKKTLFAMLCDLVCSDGNTSDTDIQLMALVGAELGLPEEEYLPIASTFMVRYIWNLQFEG